MKKTPKELAQLRQIASVDPASAGPSWRALSEAQTAIAAERTQGLPYTVAVAPGATGGPPGLCAPGAARILLDGELLPCSPDLLDPQGNSEHMSALAAMHGVLIHECGHAVHTPEERDALREEEPLVQESVVLLEEIRMEAQVIRNRPSDQKWLRASSKDIIIGEKEIEGEMAAWSGSVLIGGRVPAGTLLESDTEELRKIFEEELGKDRLEKIEDICERATRTADDDLPGLIELGRELASLRPEEDGGGGGGRIRKALQKALGEAGSEAAEEGREELEELLGEAGAREAIEQALEDAASQLSGSASGTSPEQGERLATPEERKARNELSQRFRRVRWRERTQTERPSDLPPGRLRSREALRRSAEQAEGRMVSARPWRQKKRRMTEMPKLTCGVLVDTSGSMHHAAHELAGSLWALSHAAHENGGKVAAALFGDTAETLWGAEAPPRHVREIHPSGGTQYLPDGMKLLEESLHWRAEEGPRLLVIISDGYWGWDKEDAEAAIEDARQRGIRVIHIGIGMDPEEHGADHTVSISSAADLAPLVGEAAVRALKSW